LSPVLVLSTVGASYDAAPLARDLVERRLVACVNVVEGIRSIYRWQGKVEDEGEKLLIMKTVEERVPELREILLSRHPYDVPEFIVLPIDAVEGPYRDWLIEAVSAE
jgi:periplasmic divalent cation tolerance protein